MDHIDRRKSANDVQALFYESLKIGSETAGIVGDSHDQKRWEQDAEQLALTIDKEYWNEKTEYYFDTIRRDGSKDPSIRPNALVLLLTDAVKDPHKTKSVIERIEQDDMTTSWSTLSNLDPKYHPALYHDGAVWPLTGWAALAEIKAGRSEQALYYVNCMAEHAFWLRTACLQKLTEETNLTPSIHASCKHGLLACIFTPCEMMLGMNINLL